MDEAIPDGGDFVVASGISMNDFTYGQGFSERLESIKKISGELMLILLKTASDPQEWERELDTNIERIQAEMHRFLGLYLNTNVSTTGDGSGESVDPDGIKAKISFIIKGIDNCYGLIWLSTQSTADPETLKRTLVAAFRLYQEIRKKIREVKNMA